MKTIHFAGAMALASVLAIGASSANAQITYNSNPTDGWYFGTGNNSLNNTAVDATGGAELALRVHERFQAPSTSVGDTYSFALGQDLGLDFSVNGLNTITLAALNPTLTFQDFANHVSNTFSLLGLLDNQYGPGGASTFEFQNSEPLALDPFYNPNQNNTFRFTLNTTAGSFGVTAVQGSGAVPEPAAWALMILGFGATGAMLRRRTLVAA